MFNTNRQSRLKLLREGIREVVNKIFDNPYRELGLSWFTLRKLKYFPKTGLNSNKLFGKETFFYNRTEYLHALQEIFADKIYLQNLPPNSYILDCGSHIGLSIIYLKKLCPSANIIAFEPDPANFDVLTKNVKSHGLSSVELRKEAVWISNTTLSFMAEGNMSSKIGTINEAAVKVPAIRLKDLLIKTVDFLKLDIEGAEFEVIKDIQEKLSMVENLFIEYHGSFKQNNELSDILQIVLKAGLSYYIREATAVYKQPFKRINTNESYDIQVNIFCFKPTDKIN